MASMWFLEWSACIATDLYRKATGSADIQPWLLNDDSSAV